MVPIRFVAQALQATVTWRQADQSVLITSKGKPETNPPWAAGNCEWS